MKPEQERSPLSPTNISILFKSSVNPYVILQLCKAMEWCYLMQNPTKPPSKKNKKNPKPTNVQVYIYCLLQVTWVMTICYVQFQSCVCRCPGGRSGVKSGVLITGSVCCACTAGLTTVDHLTLSFLCYLKVTSSNSHILFVLFVNF